MSAARVTSIMNEKYRQLVSKTLPHVIHSEEENEQYISKLESLYSGNKRLTKEEAQLAELLTLLIEDFENRHYQLTPASPLEVIRELMAVNELKQVDLEDIFGTASIVSEVLNGKRGLSKAHIRKLSQRFNVSPEVFFQG